MALKAKPRPEKDRSERWLLTYADLITLLMVFFVILYSFSTIDVRRFIPFKGSLSVAFSQGVLSGSETSGLNDSVSGSSLQQQISSASANSKASLSSQLQQLAEATGEGDAVLVREISVGISISLAANFLFQSGTADLKPGAQLLLGQIVEPLKEIDNPIEIVASADDLPPLSTNSQFRDNWLLGNVRAYNVLRLMVDGGKFPEERLAVGNKSSNDPLFPNDSGENRAKNRRVDVIIVFPSPDDEPIGAPFQVPVQPAARPAGASIRPTN